VSIVEEAPMQEAPPRDCGAIYRDYSVLVARWVSRLGGPCISVEDTVQDVFLVVSRRLPEFRGDCKITTWLFTITDKIIKNWRRRQRWRRWCMRLTHRIEQTAQSPHPEPVEILERREAAERFYGVLDQLSDRYRSVLLLFEVEGLSTKDIASLLDISHATVRVRLHRGRHEFLQRLRKLEEREGEVGS
jgi:RNA polymerase sigma-70 factor, ECF subfamily